MRLRHIALILVVAAALGLFAFYGWLQQALSAPGPLDKAAIVYIEPGSGTKKISATLQEAGAIDSPGIFAYGAKSMGGNLKAGEYQVPANASIEAIIELLQSGKTYQRHVTVPEGLTSAEIADIVNNAEVMTGKVDITPAEGSLLPQTYNYTRGDTRTSVIDRMSKAMKTTLDELWAKRAPDIKVKSVEEAVVLASIVEKETALPTERPRVAGVFYNRLKMGMPLQSDPTVIYAITEGKTKLGRLLTRADLDYSSPYNTYTNAGLPPGPIANPGRASLEAVLNPEHNEYFYFVANGTGGHTFAKTLEEHQRNVMKWREVEKEAK
jgi:UPF0755 protein